MVLGSWNPESTICPFRARKWPLQAPTTLRFKGKWPIWKLCLVDVSDIFSCSGKGKGKGKGGVPWRQEGAGVSFLLKILGGGGCSHERGGEGPGGCLRENWGGGGGAKYFFSGPKCPPSIKQGKKNA